LLPVAGQAAGGEIGVVFMHGRGGQPGGGSIASLIASMKSYGVTVVAPTMPWSGRRGIADYWGTMEDAMEILKREVAWLRVSGVGKIVVGGMSASGNSALAYGAHVGKIDGIMAIAPGGAVDVTTVRVADVAPRERRRIERLPRQRREYVRALRQSSFDQLARARRLIAAGRKYEITSFTIGNRGDRGRYSYEIRTTADIYFSYNDPAGLRAMSLSAARLPRTPLLWINDNQGIVRRLGLTAR
jgi:pimeloyl-ACP methyl ester carboxylesterase